MTSDQSDVWGDELWGCIVGRFQPFHRDHLSLLEQVLSERGRVIVAITNAEPSWRVPVASAPHRHLDEANVLSFHHREAMVWAATAHLDPDLIRVTPFPIHDAARWDAYLPRQVECWVRDRGPWEREKVRLLASCYGVRLVDPVVDEVSGTSIRQRLFAGDDTWQDDVPPAVARLLLDWCRESA